MGGGQELGMRAGTENVAFATGLGVACELASREDWGAGMLPVAERFWKRLEAAIPGIRRNGDPHHRLPNTVHVTIPGVAARDLLARLDGTVAASAGSACHADDEKPSGVLGAMGMSTPEALASIRFSVGKDTSLEEAGKAAAAVASAVRNLTP